TLDGNHLFYLNRLEDLKVSSVLVTGRIGSVGKLRIF
ncbi:hypothetical protein SS7213T_04490, partial [Staphylococcus simiae CCM 7213 = CCUG 51256]